MTAPELPCVQQTATVTVDGDGDAMTNIERPAAPAAVAAAIHIVVYLCF